MSDTATLIYIGVVVIPILIWLWWKRGGDGGWGTGDGGGFGDWGGDFGGGGE